MSKTRITVEIDDWAAPQVASFLQLLQATIEGPGIQVEGVSLQLAAINTAGETSSTMIEMSRDGDGNITAPISVALMGIQCGLATGSLSSSIRTRGYDDQQAKTLLGVFQRFATRTNARSINCERYEAGDTAMVDKLADDLRREGKVG